MFPNHSRFFYPAYVVCLLLFISACTSTGIPQSNQTLKLHTARYAHAAATDGKLIYVFAGSVGGNFLRDIEIINPATGDVKVLKDHLIPRRYFSAVWDGLNSIYLIGGVSLTKGKFRLERRVEIFNLLTHKISFAAPIPAPRRNSRAVLLDNSIYVFGGSTINRSNNYKLASTTTSAKFDITNNKWIKLANMPSAKSSAAIVKDGVIYVAGGFNHQEALDVFERFDPINNQWQTLAPLPRKISAHSVALVGDNMVLFGDYEKLNTTLSYDFKSSTWSESELGYQGSRHNASVTIGNTAYVIGGNINSAGKSVDLIQAFSFN